MLASARTPTPAPDPDAMALTWTRNFEPGRPLWRCAPPWQAQGPVALLDSALAGGRLGRHSFLAVGAAGPADAPPATAAPPRQASPRPSC